MDSHTTRGRQPVYNSRRSHRGRGASTSRHTCGTTTSHTRTCGKRLLHLHPRIGSVGRGSRAGRTTCRLRLTQGCRGDSSNSRLVRCGDQGLEGCHLARRKPGRQSQRCPGAGGAAAAGGARAATLRVGGAGVLQQQEELAQPCCGSRLVGCSSQHLTEKRENFGRKKML